MNFKKYHVSRNLFDKSTAVIGERILQNSVTADATVAHSDYIDVTGISNLAVSHKYIGTNFYFYSDKTNASIGYVNGYTADVPTGAKYCRINIQIGDLDNTMLNTGSTALPYEPYSSEVWHDIPHYIMGTSTDTITTLPADVYVNDTTATMGLKGNMEQSSQPSPTTPIQPSETGDKTANLWNYMFTSGYNLDTTTGIPVTYGNQTRMATLTPINISAYDSVVFNFTNTTTNTLYAMYSTIKNGVLVNRVANIQPPFIVDVSNADEIYFCIYNVTSVDAISNDSITNTMLNTGSTALPYEPFGVKIPILSGGTTTNKYLGEVQSTRKIKKLVLTGGENWYVEGSDIFYSDPITEAIQYPPICSHFFGVYALSGNNQVVISQSLRINIKTNSITHTTSDFKTYLAAQYAAGTPVCVWYVLAEPTTGIVNEPLRKIGTYADEVSGITIPTIAGANTLSIGTTLQPSEVTVNYKGWHPVQSVHEYDSNYTIATMQALTIAQLQTHTISDLQGGEWS